MAKPKTRRKRRQPSIAQRASNYTDQVLEELLPTIAVDVTMIHPGMLPVVMAEIGLQLVLNGMHLEHSMPNDLRSQMIDDLPKGATPQILMIERILDKIGKLAFKHNVAVSYRVEKGS